MQRDAVRQWKMFDFPWVELCWPDTPIEKGRNVAILVDHFGFYSLNAARIVYTIDTSHRFGFAYGTLADHGEIRRRAFHGRNRTRTRRGLVRPLRLLAARGKCLQSSAIRFRECFKNNLPQIRKPP